MKSENDSDKLEQYIEDLKSKQGPSTWPAGMRGGKSVDEFLIHGNRNAPLVQRVGAGIAGTTLVLVALLSVLVAYEQKQPFIGVVMLLVVPLAVFCFRSAFLR